MASQYLFIKVLHMFLMMSKNQKLLKVLSLHGYRQNQNIFKSKIGGFRKLLKNKIEFVFIDAPHLIPFGPQNQSNDEANGGKGWWFSAVDPLYFHSSQESNICQGFDETIDLIKTTFETQGPFDGIFGFSQGAALLAILCCLKSLEEINIKFDFAIFVAGFKSLSTPHLHLFERLGDKMMDFPTLHIIGETDQIIAKERSEQLAHYFSSPCIIYHPGGHLVPSSSNYRNDFIAFIDSLENN